MDAFEALIDRNGTFAAHGFRPGLRMLPSARTVIIGCVDPRVDPAEIFALQPGEAAVIRNVGGRINPALLETLLILRTLAQAAGQDLGAGWNLVVLHHTDCGIIGCYRHAPALLARHLGVTPTELDAMAVTDPHAAVRLDVAALRRNPDLPAAMRISGLVYDVADGTIATVLAPEPLRAP
jgi:carbonic anhydrase